MRQCWRFSAIAASCAVGFHPERCGEAAQDHQSPLLFGWTKQNFVDVQFRGLTDGERNRPGEGIGGTAIGLARARVAAVTSGWIPFKSSVATVPRRGQDHGLLREQLK